MYSCLYAAHQRNRAVLLLVVKEERPVRKPADKVIAPVLLDNPVLSHVDITPYFRAGLTDGISRCAAEMKIMEFGVSDCPRTPHYRNITVVPSACHFHVMRTFAEDGPAT